MIERLQFLTNLDIFSTTFSLNIGGRAAMRSFAGLLFTIVYLSIMLAVTVTNVQDYFDTSNPISMTDSYSTSLSPKINVYDNKVNPVLIAYSTEIDWIKAEDLHMYFTFVIEKVTWVSSTTEDGEQLFEKQFDTFPTIPCSELTEEEFKIFDFMDKTSFVYESISGYGLCGRLPRNLTVEGNGADEIFSLLSVKVLPCSSGSQCKSYKEMVKTNFQIILPNTNFNASSVERPLTFSTSYDDIYYVHPLLKQTYTSKMMQRSVMDQVGLFPKWKQTSSVFSLDHTVLTIQHRTNITSCSSEQVAIKDNPDCLPYFQFDFQSSGTVLVNKRSYVTVSGTLGNIGGTSRVVFMLLLIFYLPINHHQRKKHILSMVFPLLHDPRFAHQKNYDMKSIKKSRSTETASVFDRQSPQLAKISPSSMDRKTWVVPQEDQKLEGNSQRENDFMLPIPSEKKEPIQRSIKTCCRKRSKEKIEFQNLEDQGYAKIIDSLDVISMARQANLITVLTRLLLDSRHHELSPYLALDLWKEDRLYEKSTPSNPDSTRKKSSDSIKKDDDRISEHINAIAWNQNHRHHDGWEVKSKMIDLADVFYFGHLVSHIKHHGEDSNEAKIEGKIEIQDKEVQLQPRNSLLLKAVSKNDITAPMISPNSPKVIKMKTKKVKPQAAKPSK